MVPSPNTWVRLRHLARNRHSGRQPRSHHNSVLVVEERSRKVLSFAALGTIPVPLSFMALPAENARGLHHSIKHQPGTSTVLAAQVEREFVMAFPANHFGIAGIESTIHSVPAIWIADAAPFCEVMYGCFLNAGLILVVLFRF